MLGGLVGVYFDFKGHDLIAQLQFTFLQAGDLHFVDIAHQLKATDFIIQLAMLLF